MRELSLHILDIAENSVAAKAARIDITIAESRPREELTVTICDNGCGMTPEQLAQVSDPFYTTRTTRKVGMGVSLFRLAAEQTGGHLTLESAIGKGTKLLALFHTAHVDCIPLGDIAATLATLLSMNESIYFCYRHSVDGREFCLDTAELEQVLDGVPRSDAQVALWLQEYIREQIEALYQK